MSSNLWENVNTAQDLCRGQFSLTQPQKIPYIEWDVFCEFKVLHMLYFCDARNVMLCFTVL